MYEKVLGDDADVVDASAALLACRAVKSELEIEELRAGGRVHGELFACIPELFESGIASYELQNRLDSRARTLGHCGVIRMRGLNVETGIGIIVSGEEGAIPSHSLFPIGGPGPCPWVAAGGSARPIAKNAPIIADYLISLGGYHADCTRMAVHGSFPDEAAEIYARIVRAGSIPSQIYDEVVGRVRDANLGDNFMGPGDLAVRFIGHAVGLEVNETPVLAPRFDAPLEVGNTIAIEPKYTHPSFGVIGVENTYVVREDGLENLTDCPEDVIVIGG
jgi:Xaa-Pro aminopeptidase